MKNAIVWKWARLENISFLRAPILYTLSVKYIFFRNFVKYTCDEMLVGDQTRGQNPDWNQEILAEFDAFFSEP